MCCKVMTMWFTMDLTTASLDCSVPTAMKQLANCYFCFFFSTLLKSFPFSIPIFETILCTSLPFIWSSSLPSEQVSLSPPSQSHVIVAIKCWVYRKVWIMSLVFFSIMSGFSFTFLYITRDLDFLLIDPSSLH